MLQRRKHYRLPFKGTCTVVFEGRRYPSRLLDVSLKGALVERPLEIKPEIGQAYRLEIDLEDALAAIAMEMAVAHIESGRIGLNCFSIDMDSMTHLRRLLELNLGDPVLIEKELASLD
jgi:hypothetical protein